MNEGRQGGTIFTTADIGALIGWDTQRTRRWLLKTGAGTKVGGRVITTPSRLAQHFPELWNEVVLERPERLQ